VALEALMNINVKRRKSESVQQWCYCAHTTGTFEAEL
jgi:hypothetical protein